MLGAGRLWAQASLGSIVRFCLVKSLPSMCTTLGSIFRTEKGGERTIMLPWETWLGFWAPTFFFFLIYLKHTTFSLTHFMVKKRNCPKMHYKFSTLKKKNNHHSVEVGFPCWGACSVASWCCLHWQLCWLHGPARQATVTPASRWDHFLHTPPPPTMKNQANNPTGHKDQ